MDYENGSVALRSTEALEGPLHQDVFREIAAAVRTGAHRSAVTLQLTSVMVSGRVKGREALNVPNRFLRLIRSCDLTTCFFYKKICTGKS